MSDKYFEVICCPACGSTNVIVHNMITTGKLYFVGKGIICKDCKKEFHIELEEENVDPYQLR